MDRFGEWRPINPAADEEADKPASNSAPARPAKAADPARPEANVIGVRLIGLLCGMGLAVVGAYLALTAEPATGSGLAVAGSPAFLELSTDEPLAVATAVVDFAITLGLLAAVLFVVGAVGVLPAVVSAFRLAPLVPLSMLLMSAATAIVPALPLAILASQFAAMYLTQVTPRK